MCDALDAVDVRYQTFDILGDEEIRQGLKKYSQWPTYPQARAVARCLLVCFAAGLLQGLY